MTHLLLSLVCILGADPQQLGPGNHFRSVDVHGQKRSYLVHVPNGYDPEQPTPVVLAYHGAGINSVIMAAFCGMSDKAEQAGFIVVYPNGTTPGNLMRTFNSGGWQPSGFQNQSDDVGFADKLLDDLEQVVNVDKKRVFATGMSNGGMMCYRLASELSERIAAIAPVAGTMCIAEMKSKRPVPVMHFHGTADTVIPFDGPKGNIDKFLSFKSVDETMNACVKRNGCETQPTAQPLPDATQDGTTVEQRTYKNEKNGADVVLYVIKGGGHTWPGRVSPVRFLGRSTNDISANDLIWEFFEKHPMKDDASKE